MSKEALSPKELTPDYIQSRISSIYGLNIIELPVLMEEGVENAAWVIKTDKEKFISKVFAQEIGPKERILKEVKLCNFLFENDINVPEFVQSKRKEYVEEININNSNFFMFLMVYRDLRRVYPGNITDEELIKVSKNMANINKILQDYTDLGVIKQQDNLYKHLKPLRWFDIFVSSPNSTIYSSKDIEHFKNLDERMNKYYSENVPEKNLTESIIHGDLALGHTQFLPDGRVYFFDFTDFTYGPVSQEVAVFLNNLYREDGISFEKWEKYKNLVLDTYNSIMSLNENDQKSIIPFIIRRISGEILYLSDFAKKLGKSVNIDGNKRRFELAEYLLTMSNY